MKIARPVNDTQERFNELCDLGGGRGGGPVRTRIQQLLKESGRTLSIYMEHYVKQTLMELADYNPWHVCFAIGVSWGHLAKEDVVFTEAAARLLDKWNNDDLRIARRLHYERGPEPLVQSLWGGALLFQRVRLPEGTPTDLKVLQQAQQRWLSPILSPDRPGTSAAGTPSQCSWLPSSHRHRCGKDWRTRRSCYLLVDLSSTASTSFTKQISSQGHPKVTRSMTKPFNLAPCT